MGGVWRKMDSAANTAAVHGENGPERVEVGLGEGGGGGQNDRDVLQQAARGREEGLSKERPSFLALGLKKKVTRGGGGQKFKIKDGISFPLRTRSFHYNGSRMRNLNPILNKMNRRFF
jgi:hypothetical protein